jgi:MscS family membrane protein
LNFKSDLAPYSYHRIPSIPWYAGLGLLLPSSGCWGQLESIAHAEETVAHKYGWIGHHLPTFFFDFQFWGIQLWQWFGIVLCLVMAVIFGYIASFISRKILHRLVQLTRWTWDDMLIENLRGPLIMTLAVLGFLIVLPFLALQKAPQNLFISAGKFLSLMALGWFLIRVVDLIAAFLILRLKDRSDNMGMAMVPVARKMLKPIVGAIVLIIALQNVGMNVSGLLAGLGIGGLAFALAGKNTLENLFGSIVISFDRPFKIGDFVKVGEIIGNVEDVGLRSTRIRTLERILVTIPNAQMADSKIENYACRDKMRLFVTLGFQYDTTYDQLRYLVDELKRYFMNHPRVVPDSFNARFAGYGNYSLNIDAWCYINTTDFGEFTGIRETIFFDWLNIVQRAGVQFAYPSQAIYHGGQLALSDPEKARQAATIVSQRQAAGELCLPEIPLAMKQSGINLPQ